MIQAAHQPGGPAAAGRPAASTSADDAAEQPEDRRRPDRPARRAGWPPTATRLTWPEIAATTRRAGELRRERARRPPRPAQRGSHRRQRVAPAAGASSRIPAVASADSAKPDRQRQPRVEQQQHEDRDPEGAHAAVGGRRRPSPTSATEPIAAARSTLGSVRASSTKPTTPTPDDAPATAAHAGPARQHEQEADHQGQVGAGDREQVRQPAGPEVVAATSGDSRLVVAVHQRRHQRPRVGGGSTGTDARMPGAHAGRAGQQLARAVSTAGGAAADSTAARSGRPPARAGRSTRHARSERHRGQASSAITSTGTPVCVARDLGRRPRSTVEPGERVVAEPARARSTGSEVTPPDDRDRRRPARPAGGHRRCAVGLDARSTRSRRRPRAATSRHGHGGRRASAAPAARPRRAALRPPTSADRDDHAGQPRARPGRRPRPRRRAASARRSGRPRRRASRSAAVPASEGDVAARSWRASRRRCRTTSSSSSTEVKRAVLGAAVEDRLRRHRADPGQRLELGLGRGVEVDHRAGRTGAVGAGRRPRPADPGRRRHPDHDLLAVGQHPGQVERAEVDPAAGTAGRLQRVDDPRARRQRRRCPGRRTLPATSTTTLPPTEPSPPAAPAGRRCPRAPGGGPGDARPRRWTAGPRRRTRRGSVRRRAARRATSVRATGGTAGPPPGAATHQAVSASPAATTASTAHVRRREPRPPLQCRRQPVVRASRDRRERSDRPVRVATGAGSGRAGSADRGLAGPVRVAGPGRSTGSGRIAASSALSSSSRRRATSATCRWRTCVSA